MRTTSGKRPRIALLGAAASANTRSLVAGLLEAGHQVDVITLHPGRIDGVQVHEIDPWSRLPAKLGYLRALPTIRKVLDRLSPDLVIGYFLSSYGFLASLAWKGPLALIPAGSDILLPRSNRLLSRLRLGYVSRHGDLFIAWARHMAARLQELGVPGRRILVLPRGVDKRIFNRDGERIDGRYPATLVATRSLLPKYRLEGTIRALRGLVDSGHDAGLRLLGGGPLRRSLELLAGELDVGQRVAFAGFQPPTGVASHLRGSQIYVSTSPSDGASASLFEAMACGSFPVVTDIPANREWIRHGENGLLFPVDDHVALAESIGRALESPALMESASRVNGRLAEQDLDRRKNLQRISDALSRLAAETR